MGNLQSFQREGRNPGGTMYAKKDRDVQCLKGKAEGERAEQENVAGVKDKGIERKVFVGVEPGNEGGGKENDTNCRRFHEGIKGKPLLGGRFGVRKKSSTKIGKN